MASGIAKVFSGNIVPSQLNNTADIGNATAVYLVSPDTVDDWSFEAFLQLELSPFQNRRIRLDDDMVDFDTITVWRIPIEYQNMNLPKYISIVTDVATNIEVFAITPTGVSAVLDTEPELPDVNKKLDYLIDWVNSGVLSDYETTKALEELAKLTLQAIAMASGNPLIGLTANTVSLAVQESQTDITKLLTGF